MEEWKEANHSKNLIGKRDDKTDDDIVDKIKKTNIEEEEDPECPECGESPCVFFKHEEQLVADDDTEYGLATSVEPIPSNNIRRKKLSSTNSYAQWWSIGRRSSETIAELLCLGNQGYATLGYFYGFQVGLELT
jgi:hypothetical protein